MDKTLQERQKCLQMGTTTPIARETPVKVGDSNIMIDTALIRYAARRVARSSGITVVSAPISIEDLEQEWLQQILQASM
jgi:hypothetical protein